MGKEPMILLQIPGSEALLTEAVKVSPDDSSVYGYLVLLLVSLVLVLLTVLYQLFKRYETLSIKVFDNALEQTRTFTMLSSYMERNNSGVTELNSNVENIGKEVTASKEQILRRVSTVGIKLQRDETIQDPD